MQSVFHWWSTDPLFPPPDRLWRGPLVSNGRRGSPRQWPGPWSISFQMAGFKTIPTPAQTLGTFSHCKACPGHSTGLRMGACKQEECAEWLGSNNKKRDHSKKLLLESSQEPWRLFLRLLLFDLYWRAPSVLPKNIHCGQQGSAMQGSRNAGRCLPLLPAFERHGQVNLSPEPVWFPKWVPEVC